MVYVIYKLIFTVTLHPPRRDMIAENFLVHDQ